MTLREAINNNGTTIIDFNVNGESGRYTNYLCVYGKAGEPCLKCNDRIEKLKLQGAELTYALNAKKVFLNVKSIKNFR